MESLSPIALTLLFSVAFLVVGWLLLRRFDALLRDRKEHQSAQTIVPTLKGLKVEECAKEIVQYLSRLRGDFAKYRDGFSLLEKHLGHAHVSYQAIEKLVEQFGQRLPSAGRRNPSNFVPTIPKWDSQLIRNCEHFPLCG